MSISLLLKPDLDKKAYRMKCRFVIEPYPAPDSLKEGALKAHDWFVTDMAKEGWTYVSGERPRLRGPFPQVVPMTIHRPHIPSSSEMFLAVMQGARFRAGAETIAKTVLPLSQSEYWEYELALVFYRNPLVADVPDLHEEREELLRQ